MKPFNYLISKSLLIAENLLLTSYDDKNIEKSIMRKGWKFIIALKKKRSAKTEKEYAATAKSKDWRQIQKLFKRHRWIKWITVCLPKNSPKKERTEFRIRQITGYLRGVGKAQHTDLFGI